MIEFLREGMFDIFNPTGATACYHGQYCLITGQNAFLTLFKNSFPSSNNGQIGCKISIKNIIKAHILGVRMPFYR